LGNFDRVKRIQTGAEDWVDVRPPSVGESRELDKRLRKAKDDEESANLRIDFALSRIVAWSDDLPVSVEQARKLPIEIAWRLYGAVVGLEDAELPLATGSDSTATSEA